MNKRTPLTIYNRRAAYFCAVLLSMLLWSACGPGDSDVQEEPEVTQAAPESPKSDTIKIDLRDPHAPHRHPCRAVTREFLETLFVINDPSSVSKDSSDSGYPVCFFQWTGDEKTTQRINGRDQEVQKTCRVTVTLLDRPVSLDMYEQAVASLPGELQDVEIGDEGVWSLQRHQLTARQGQTLFHVQVDCSNDNAKNRENAKKIGQQVIDVLL